MKVKHVANQLSFDDTQESGAQVIQLRSKKARRQSKRPGVVEQVRVAFSPENRLATLSGFILGGFVPVGSFVVCHGELPGSDGWRHWALLVLIGGGLLFSAKSVWQWSAAAFADRWKASGFVVLVEGIMVLSSTVGLSYAALGLLVAINGIATGVILGRDGAV